MVGDVEEGGLDEDFHPEEVFAEVAGRLKRNQLLLWLAGHQRETTAKSGDEEQGDTSLTTLLADIFIDDWKTCTSDQQQEMPELLTLWTQNWVRGPLDDVSWGGTTTHILATLVKAREIDLAVDFLQFMTRKQGWAIYVQGRLRILTGDYAQASLDFRQAAEDMANGKLSDTAGLISPHEEDSFGRDKSAYFQHVAALFEKLQMYSYVADFAQLALDNTAPLSNFSSSIARLDRQKSQQESPALEQIDRAEKETQLLRLMASRDDILNRLFNALALTGRFEGAFAALQQIETAPMRRSGLKKLVEVCVKQDCVPMLLSLPFEGGMAEDADKTLLDHAKKELASGPSSSIATPYYQILYAFRTQQSDFRGAAEILYEHLERMRCAPHHRAAQDPEDETLLQVYVLLINTLACCGEEDGWVLAEPFPGLPGVGAKRKLVTLADVRRDYGAEMDRRSEVLSGRIPIVGGGEDVL
ncbi:hypothetical protein LTR53_008726 [Teratosphaeriaceae sp. CCFEE 6253]|nr:hypothetical protein LTR53_008726 [Teratosphaeriaceae sp. CCFEE 6253]